MRGTRAVTQGLVVAVETGLRQVADPTRAPAMQAYMKSEMPFLGVGSSERRGLCREVFAKYPFDDAADWRRCILRLWRGARHRESRYVAIDLLLAKRYARFLDLDALPLLEEIVVTGAWWDYVDLVAAHAFGRLLEEHPKPMRQLLLRWAKSGDIWKRRTAILAQLRRKERTDEALLYACIEPSLDHADFFLRKGIGWALRQYAWTHPDEVRRKVAELGDRLSPLSRREATKHLGSAGRSQAKPRRAGGARAKART